MILIQKYKHSPKISGGSLARMMGIEIYSNKLKPKNKGQLKINWGLSNIPWLTDDNILNKPEAIKKASNKSLTFNEFIRHNIIHNSKICYPLCTDDKDVATLWLDEGKVVCRQLLSASSGRGIVIATNQEELVDAPLYVKYIKKKYEIRVHIFQDRSIYVQQKKKLSTEQLEERGITIRNKYIRNMDNGYIFSGNLTVSEEVKDKAVNQSILAVSALGLDFGAVDVLVTKDDEVFVLEVNTAPGLEGTTLTKYYEVFKELL